MYSTPTYVPSDNRYTSCCSMSMEGALELFLNNIHNLSAMPSLNELERCQAQLGNPSDVHWSPSEDGLVLCRYITEAGGSRVVAFFRPSWASQGIIALCVEMEDGRLYSTYARTNDRGFGGIANVISMQNYTDLNHLTESSACCEA